VSLVFPSGTAFALVARMRLFDHRDKMFVVDGQGRQVFYPLGRLGRGRILDNEQHARYLRIRMSWMSRVHLCVLSLVAVAFIVLRIIEIRHVAILVFGSFGLFVLLLFLLVRRYPISDEKLPKRSRQKSWVSRYIGTPILWFGLIFTALLDVAFGIGILLAHASGAEKFEYTPAVVFTLLLLATVPFYCGWRLYSRRTPREVEDVDPDIFP